MRVRGGSGAAAGPVPPPAGLRPMQPTAARELPADQAGRAFEPKWDGYRALGHVMAAGWSCAAATGSTWPGWFPELAELAGALGGRGAVLDGEVAAFDDRGRPGFEALQQRIAGRAGRRRGAPVTYLVLDLLWLEGRLLVGLPYSERRRLLEDLAVAGDAWQTVGSFPRGRHGPAGRHRHPGPGGVVAKRLASTCQPGRRTRHWLKVKHYQRETFLVGGFVPNPTGQVRSLLVGLPDPRHQGRLRFAGRVDHSLVPAARRRAAPPGLQRPGRRRALDSGQHPAPEEASP